MLGRASEPELDEIALIVHEAAAEHGRQYVELEVVGEGSYQQALEQIAGPRSADGKRHITGIAIRCEPTNSYDHNACRVESLGLLLGYIPRDEAAHLSVAMQARCGGVAEGIGVIVGGWDDGDTVGHYGIRVWIQHDALQRIGLDPTLVRRRNQPLTGQVPGRPASAGGTMRTGFSEAWATDEADDSYDLSWFNDLPPDEHAAITALTKLLAAEPHPIARHYQYAELEKRLYRRRDLDPTALAEFDDVCRRHDAEMPDICEAFRTKWQQIPLLELYRQMAIRRAKSKDWNDCISWTERGLSMYGSAARQDFVEDLLKRREHALNKLAATQ